MDNNCSIYAQMHLVFDNDFDVYSITNLLGIVPKKCKARNETRISPLTGKQIEGFWTIETEEREERDLKIILDELTQKFVDQLANIKKICEENQGEVIFDIIPFFYPISKPALYFEREFLEIAHFLDARIQIDMYVG